jgi:hypothetical protein
MLDIATKYDALAIAVQQFDEIETAVDKAVLKAQFSVENSILDDTTSIEIIELETDEGAFLYQVLVQFAYAEERRVNEIFLNDLLNQLKEITDRKLTWNRNRFHGSVTLTSSSLFVNRLLK